MGKETVKKAHMLPESVMSEGTHTPLVKTKHRVMRSSK